MATSIHTGFLSPSWVLIRLGVYIGAAFVAAVAFLVGAFLYSQFADAPVPAKIELQSEPLPVSVPPLPPSPPRSDDGRSLLISDSGAIRLSDVLGAPVYDATNVRIGNVNDFVMNADGSLQAVSVKQTPGWWPSLKGQKTVVVPMGSVQWTSHSGEWRAQLKTGFRPEEFTTTGTPTKEKVIRPAAERP